MRNDIYVSEPDPSVQVITDPNPHIKEIQIRTLFGCGPYLEKCSYISQKNISFLKHKLHNFTMKINIGGYLKLFILFFKYCYSM